MPKPTHTPWWKSILVATFLIVVLASLVVAWFQTEELTTKWIVGVFFSICGVLFVFSTIHDWMQDRRLRQLLKGREGIDPNTFGTRYFSDLPGGPMAAAMVRRLLDEHLKMELGGLRPDDKLDCLRDWIDPLFMDELASRLGFEPPADCEEFVRLVHPLHTVRDLVEAVVGKPRGKHSRPAALPEDAARSR